jgi:PQQ-dependent dehydrogenase (methanol/ethanol family)
MKPRRISSESNNRRLAISTVVIALAAVVVFAQQKGASSQGGVYTDAQAARGKTVYDQRCALCHGARLEAGSASPLTGSAFMAKWGRGDRSVDDLFYITRTQMPYDAAGTLTRQQYIDVVAYILKVNGYAAGKTDLPADSPALKKIKLQSQGAATAAAEGEETAAPATNGATMPTSTGPSQKELNAAHKSTSDWLTSNHDYAGQRFVDLSQINQQNASSLKPIGRYDSGDKKAFHNNPIVYRGIMFITTSNSTIALDATTCALRWRHDWKPKSLQIWPPNRGVAIKDGRVVRATTDGYLFALDLQTGNLLWEKKLVASEKNEGSFNMAPLIFEDKIILGLGISEQGIKGWIGAFKLETGEPLWRFNTVPNDGEPGAETWGKASSREKGGGAVWAPLALDAEQGLVYVPVANPAPDFYDDIRPGANLYTGSLVVLDARTGKLKWYYQAIPHDTHDWDTTQVSPLFSTTIGGKTRKLVAVLGKDGMMHVLDRDTHQQVYETPVTTRSNVEAPLTVAGVRACPGVLGGVLWNGPSYNPRTNMLYVPAVDWCGVYKKAEELREGGAAGYMGGSYVFDPPDKARGWLTAIDASTGQVRWRYESKKPMIAAVTATSGDVLFTGELTGDMIVLDARNGNVLYRFNTDGPMNGGVVTYAINGKQYVAVASGSASGFWGVPPASATVVLFALP